MGFCSQLWLLMWKNLLLQKRKVLVTLFEILIPVFFACLMLLLRIGNVPIPHENITHYPTKSLTEGNSLYVIKEWNELGFTPETTLTMKIISKLQSRVDTAIDIKNAPFYERKTSFIPKGFKSESDMVNYYKNHRDNLTLAIVFSGLDTATVLPTNVKYYIRPKAAGKQKSWFTSLNFPEIPTQIPREKLGESDYISKGLLNLQVFLAEVFMEEWGQNIRLNVSNHRMAYPFYIEDPLISILQIQFSFFVILSFVLSVIQYTKVLVDEKEQRLKESMKLMGLLPSAHWASWFIMFFIYLAITVGIYVYILCASVNVEAGPVLSNSDSYVFYVFMLTYAVSIITFCFMISVFVQKANVGAALSGVLFFVFYLPYFHFDEQYETYTYREKLLMCLLFNQAMSFGCKIIGLYEGTGEGIQWDNLDIAVNNDDNFTVQDCIQMMLVDSAIHLVITWYVDNVFPGEFGVPEPFYFFLTSKYWLGTSATKGSTEAAIEGSKYFERDPVGLIAGIRIVNLYKQFGDDKVAVNHLSLNMYEGQITVLLGHNGAGKTTTMSMLTGFIPANSGTAYIYDKDINTEISAIRKSLGLCPQHDILFKTLTVEEHLKFFAKLKGCPCGKLNEEVDTMIKEVGLEAKRYSASHTLSGGQKRKLGVAIALIYGSKVVILDEPSSGMDPAARRQTWEVLQNNRAGRTVLLTTHYMDEADVLGDRIAIMAEGVVKCCGTSLFLKKLYGAGYHLVVVKGAKCKSSDITNLVTSTIPGAEFETETNTESTYILPDDQSALFAGLFRSLENQKEGLGIINFGVSATTMEEVFLKVGEASHEEGITNDAFDNVNQSMSSTTGINQVAETPDTSGSGGPPPERIASTVTEITLNVAASIHSEPVDPPGFPKSSHTFVAAPNADILAFAQGYEKLAGFDLQLSQLHGIVVKKVINVWRNWALTTAQILLPMIMACIAVKVGKDTPVIGEPFKSFKLDDLGKTIVPYAILGSPSTTADKVVSNYLGLIGSAHTKTKVDLSQQTMDDYILGRAKDMGVGQYNKKILVGAQFEELPGQDVAATVLFNGQPYHTEPIGLTMVLNALIKHYSGSSVNIDSGIYPFPEEEGTDALESSKNADIVGFVTGICICLGMAFFAASIVYFPVSERTSGAKHLQVVSGIGHVVFWVGSFLCDYAIFMLMLVLLVIVFLIFDNPAYNDQLGLIALLINTFALANLFFIYFLHFFFASAPNALVVLIMYNLFSGMIPMGIMLVLRISEEKETHDTLNFIFPLAFPNYCLGTSFQDMYKNYQYGKFCTDTVNYKTSCLQRQTPCCKGYGKGCPSEGVCLAFADDYGQWEEPGIGRYMAYMVMQGAVFAVLTMLMEYNVHEILKDYIFDIFSSKPEPVDVSLEDDDVAAEKKRINTTPIDVLIQQEPLLLVNLYKRYGSFVAVNQSCIGIPENECFGLLGTNGAGKTTTFKMLTGDVTVTSGNAYLKGFDIKHNIKKVQAIMGYCPQFDALLDQMTGRETLVMYARLRGVPAANIPNCVNCLSDVLTLSPHMDKPSKTYSGGNKRKLSVGIALIGNPAFVLLDEPSSGMDPAARRQMWTVLSQVRQTGKTLILTSHSMEECEALCTRIVIMVRGRFVCLGSTQHLKSKFGQGYTLEAKMATLADGKFAPNEVVVNYIKDCFPDSKLFDEHEGYVHMQILDPNIHLADVFDAMEKAKVDLNVEDYNVHQTSLEQVFLAFTRI